MDQTISQFWACEPALLAALLKRVPAKVRGGSVQCVRQWRAQHAKATKVAGNPRSSVTEIESAINAMELCGE